MRAIKIILITVVLGLLTLHTLPLIIRDIAVWALYQQGAEKVQLKRIAVDWTSGEVTVHKLLIENNQEIALKIDRLLVNLKLSRLLDRQIYLSDFHLESSRINLDQREGQLFLGSILLVQPDNQTPVEEDPTEEPAFQVGLDSLTLDNVDLYLSQPRTAFDLNIGELHLEKLYQWEPESVTQVRLNGLINGAPLVIDSSALPLPEKKEFSASITLNNLSLTPIGALLEKELTGMISTELLLELQLDGEAITLSQSGTVSGQSIAFEQTNQQFSLASFEWSGDMNQLLHVEKDSETGPALTGIDSQFDLTLDGLTFSDPLIDLTLNDTHISPKLGAVLNTGRLNLKAEHSIGQLQVELEGRSAGITQLTGSIEISEDQESALDEEKLLAGLEGQAKWRAEQISYQEFASQTQLEISELKADPVFKLDPTGTLPESAHLTLSFNALDVSQGDAVNLQGLPFSTTLDLASNGDSYQSNFELQLEGLDGNLADQQISTKSANSSGSVSLDHSFQLLTAQIAVSGGETQITSDALNLTSAPLTSSLYLEPMGDQFSTRFNLSGTQLDVEATGNQISTDAWATEGKLMLGADFQPDSGDLNLNLGNVRLDSGDLGMTFSSLALDMIKLLADKDQINTELTLDLENLSVQQQANQVSASSIELQGPIGLTLSEGAPSTLSLGTQIVAKTLTVNTPDIRLNASQLTASPALNTDLMALKTQGNLGLRTGALAVQLQGDKRVTLAALDTDLNITADAAAQQLSGPLAFSQINYSGPEQNAVLDRFSTQLQLSNQQDRLNWTAPLNLSGLALDLASDRIALDTASVATQGQLDLTTQELDFDLSAIKVSQLNGRTAATGAFSLGEASVNGLILEDERLQISDVNLAELSLSRAESPYLTLSGLTLDTANLSSDRVVVGDLLTQGVQINVTRNAEGVLNITPSPTETLQAESDTGSEPAVAETSEDTGSELYIAINRFEAINGFNLAFQDLSMAAPVKATLSAKTALLSNFETGSANPAQLKVVGQINERSDFDIDAQVSSPNNQYTGQWTAIIKQLSLPLISPVVQSTAGYQIRSGVLNLEATGQVNDNTLKGDNRIRIQRLEVAAAQNAKTEQTDQLFTMPLSSAISLLEDSDRVIDLNIPVTGDLDDPKFNYEEIIQKVVAEAVKDGALAFLTNSLQPYGALISLATSMANAESSGRFIQLQPMVFGIGETTLNAEGVDYANKLAGMMQERPGLTLEICPIAILREETGVWNRLQDDIARANDSQDRSETVEYTEETMKQRLAEAMVSLANERAFSLSDQMIALGIPQERLVVCLAKTGVGGGEPRLELAF